MIAYYSVEQLLEARVDVARWCPAAIPVFHHLRDLEVCEIFVFDEFNPERARVCGRALEAERLGVVLRTRADVGTEEASRPDCVDSQTRLDQVERSRRGDLTVSNFESDGFFESDWLCAARLFCNGSSRPGLLKLLPQGLDRKSVV